MTGRYPQLIVIGAQKCATTSLWRYLDAHPDITMAARKETNFFLHHHEQGPGFYAGLFDPETPVAAEVCPIYTARPFSEGVAERIANLVPEARLVYSVRDPVKRIVSHWLHGVARGREPRSFPEVVAAPEFPDTEYVQRTRYWWQLEPFLEAFPRERVHVLLSEELARDPAGTLRELFAFAGVDAGRAPAEVAAARLHPSEDKLQPPRLARALLAPGATATAPPPGRRRARLLEALTRRFGRPLPEAEVGPVERARIHELVRDDVAALAAHLGRPLWGVAGATARPRP